MVNRVLRPFTEKLREIDPEVYRDAVFGGEGLIPLVSERGVRVDRKAFFEAYRAAQAALTARPPLRVDVGDLACIGGKAFRIGSVNAEARRVRTVRVDPDGEEHSSDWCNADYPDGTTLEPATDLPAEAYDWPAYPEGMHDAHSRARFNLSRHTRVLVEAGLGDDPDD